MIIIKLLMLLHREYCIIVSLMGMKLLIEGLTLMIHLAKLAQTDSGLIRIHMYSFAS